MPTVPDVGALLHATRCQVRVSASMVAQFAALTGDRSSLHMDDAFARRSAYRQPVVHGMLPVACLSLLPALHLEGYRSIPVALAGRFNLPVLADDELVVTAAPARQISGRMEVEIDYEIARGQAVVTAGTLTLAHETNSSRHATAVNGTAATLLTCPGELNAFLLEDIGVGAVDNLDFTVTDEAITSFVSMMFEGADDDGKLRASGMAERIHLPNLLSMLLYSTSVGMSLPGASATFLEFSARVARPVQLDTPYRLRGQIAHRSTATRIVKKELLVTEADNDEVVIRGKASALVAKPPSRMLRADELAAQGTDFGLDGKVVLITGASRGIGETTAKLFALHGARVIVNFHRGADDAERVVDEIVHAGAEAVAIRADVSNAEDVANLVARAQERFGAIHVLVNNAARDYRPVPFLRLSWDDMQKDLDVIVKGAFLCCQAVIPLMLEQKQGRIINVSSIATDHPPVDQAKYVVAKSALVGLTRSLSIEFASRNILANLVVPNFVETDFVAHVPDGFRNRIARDIPMQRAASPVDVARAIVFLASAYSSFTTGQKIMVNGGGPPYL